MGRKCDRCGKRAANVCMTCGVAACERHDCACEAFACDATVAFWREHGPHSREAALQAALTVPPAPRQGASTTSQKIDYANHESGEPYADLLAALKAHNVGAHNDHSVADRTEKRKKLAELGVTPSKSVSAAAYFRWKGRGK